MPLHMAAENGHVDAVLLVVIGAELEASDADGGTPLHVAAYRGHVAVVTTLVEAGADKEASAADGVRPLHEAACHGHVAVVKTLIELGVTKTHLLLMGRHRCTPRQATDVWRS